MLFVIHQNCEMQLHDNTTQNRDFTRRNIFTLVSMIRALPTVARRFRWNYYNSQFSPDACQAYMFMPRPLMTLPTLRVLTGT